MKVGYYIIACITTFILTCFLLLEIRNSIRYKFDYTSSIKVDKSEKIEQAISNCVNDVKSRNFIVVSLEVLNYGPNNIEIICSGVTKYNLIKEN